MSEYIRIDEALQRLTKEFNWFHSFVRELYFSSAHYFQRNEDGKGNLIVGDAWGPRDLRLVVAVSGNPSIFGIEFLCIGVQSFSFQRLDELAFACHLNTGEVRLDFTDLSGKHGDCWVVAKKAYVAFLGDEYLGPWLRLGNEPPREDATDAARIDDCWRRCSHCSNAWIERPVVAYSRCTECGMLTKLVGSPP